jgi:hypothetical protein
MSINESRKLFSKLEELYEKEFKYLDIIMYEQIINITFAYMGIRIACSIYILKKNNISKYLIT